MERSLLQTVRYCGRPSKGIRRAIYLTPEAAALLVRQRERHQSGPLLGNNRGEACTENTIGLALRPTRERASIPQAIG